MNVTRKCCLAWAAAIAMSLPRLGLGAIPSPAPAPALFVEHAAAPRAYPFIETVRVNFAELMRLARSEGIFRPDSVRVMMDGQAVPFAVTKEPAGTYLVAAELPGGRALGTNPPPMRLRISFGAEAVSNEFRRGGTDFNLLRDGGFETPSNYPACLDPSPKPKNDFQAGSMAVIAGQPRAGSGCLRIKGKNAVRTVLAPVMPGERYDYSFYFRLLQEPRGQVFYAQVHWLDAQHNRVLADGMLAGQSARVPGWRHVRKIWETPQNAAFAAIMFYTYEDGYAVDIDDVSIAPSLARIPEILAARTPRGQVSLRAGDPLFRRFDFGVAERVWPGFTAVTPDNAYTPQSGFGWTRKFAFSIPGNKALGNLDCDFLAARDSELRVDLPNGKYRVWIRKGNPSLDYPVYAMIHRGQKLFLESRLVFEENPSARDIFDGELMRAYHERWTPDMDIQKTLIDPFFTEKTFPVDVTNNCLAIRIQNLPMTAMVIYPERAAPEAERELDYLAQQLRRSLPLELDLGVPEPALEPTAAERARGFVLFQRDPEEPVWPTARPAAEERLTGAQVAAARGQRAPIVFCLWPLKDLKDASVRVGALGSANGAALPAEAADIRFVRYQPYLMGPEAYYVKPAVLDRRPALDLPKDITQRYWLRLTIPAGQPAGTYTGAVAVSVGGEVAAQFPLAVRVLPLTLPAPRIAFGTYYSGGIAWYTRVWTANILGPNFGDDPEMDRIAFDTERAYLRFMREVGYNSAAWNEDGRSFIRFKDTRPIITDNNFFVRWMDAYTRAGFGPMPWYGFTVFGNFSARRGMKMHGAAFEFLGPEWRSAYRNMILDYSAEGRRRGWPEIIWYLWDELSNYGPAGAEHGIALGKLAGDLPGTRTIASMNGRPEHAAVSCVDIAMPNFAFPITDATVKMVRDAGAELWLYNVSDTRYSFGLYPWALRAGGRFQWHFGKGGDTRFGLCPDTSYGVQRLGPGGEVFPNAVAEAHHEGIDDYRFLQKLEETLANGQGDAGQRAAAEAFLKQLRASIPTDIRASNFGQTHDYDPRGTGRPGGSETGGWARLNAVRLEAARHIMALAAGTDPEKGNGPKDPGGGAQRQE